MTETLGDFLTQSVQKAMNAYRANPELVEEHARQEAGVASGGYSGRQFYELIQNGADQIQEAEGSGNVTVVLTPSHFYCANQGAGFTEEGIRALLMSHMSCKKGGQIGRFGLGFKSVLKCCEQPEVFSSSISFRFNPVALREEMHGISPGLDTYPKMRTAEIVDLIAASQVDSTLQQLLTDHTTVIRLKLLANQEKFLHEKVTEFPAEFLLFSPHVRRLRLCGMNQQERQLDITKDSHITSIRDGGNFTEWRVFRRDVLVQNLTSAARNDMGEALKRSIDRDDKMTLPVVWAAAVHGLKRETRQLWAFFPTKDQMTLQGILNAPWNTYSDRQHLREGEFNRELLRHAAELVSESLPQLNTPEDPVRYLDALPAVDGKSWADQLLGDVVVEQLQSKKCLATRKGNEEVPNCVRLLPKIAAEQHVTDLLAELEEWLPADIGHPKITAGVRSARAERIGASEITLEELIEAVLLEPTIQRSIAAIRLVDALLDCKEIKNNEQNSIRQLDSVLTAAGELVAADPKVLAFAGDHTEANEAHSQLVHPDVAADAKARQILEQRFKIPVVDMTGAGLLPIS